MAHFFITLPPPTPTPTTAPWLDCEYDRELPKCFGEIAPSCLSKFAFAWIINLSQEWRRRRQDFFFPPLFPARLRDWGYWDYSASQYARLLWDLSVCFLQSGPFSLPLISGNACSTPNRKLSLFFCFFFPSRLLIKENAVVSFFRAKTKNHLSCPSRCLFILFYKRSSWKTKKVLKSKAETFYFVLSECK